MRRNNFYHFLIIIGLFIISTPVLAQDCSRTIVDNKTINGTQVLKTEQVTLVVRGTYSYGIELMSDEKGITARFFSKGGVTFNLNDEIIFMDGNKNRKSYRFIESNNATKQGDIMIIYCN